MNDPRRFAPATARNREPILDVLQRVLPPEGLVLEIASGTGEHAVFMARALPTVVWQPTDLSPHARASIDAWREQSGLSNLRPALSLDAAAEGWPVASAAALVCINMIHISPWSACQGLFQGAEQTLDPGGVLYLYGPYKRGGRHTAPSNESFDQSLRAQDPQWGVRDLDDVRTLATDHGFRLAETVPMPANNLSLVFLREQTGKKENRHVGSERQQ